MRIRNYGEGDLDACRALWVELVQRHRDIYDDQSIGGDDPGLYFDEHLGSVGPERTWVAESDDGVVGFTSLIVKGQDAEIEPVVVSASHRGKGVGEGLVRRAAEEAKELGVSCLFVRPVARNREAISFFRDCWFGTVGHVQLFRMLDETPPEVWKDGIDLFGMAFRY